MAGQESMPPTTGANTEGVPAVRPPTQMSVLDPSGLSTEAADAGVTVVSVGQADAAAVVDVAPPGDPCTTLTFGGSCYELFDSFVSWDVAEQRCIAWGGKLASIESPEEDRALNGWPAELGIVSADGSGIWLGGTDAQRDGEFLWVDGSPFALQGWAPGQPDNGAGIDCIEKRNDGVGQWYDRRCSDALRYLCERPL